MSLKLQGNANLIKRATQAWLARFMDDCCNWKFLTSSVEKSTGTPNQCTLHVHAMILMFSNIQLSLGSLGPAGIGMHFVKCTLYYKHCTPSKTSRARARLQNIAIGQLND
eukprot:scaffold71806_cov30-Tisochrysis_lutea.AAC.1